MRCFEQVRTDIAYPQLNVKIIGMSSGFAYPQLGATHTCVEDLSIMRAISNMTVVYPADGMATLKATLALVEYPGPVYMRLGRQAVPAIYDEAHEFVIGKATILKEGADIAVISAGSMVHLCLEAARELDDKRVDVRVIDMATIKPIDEAVILRAARETGRILTVEEHNLAGGLGSAVAEVVVQEHPVPVEMLGICNETPPPGSREQLLAKYGLTKDNIKRRMASLASASAGGR
jgi:transketolase